MLGEEVKNFLPRPEDLVLKKEARPVTKKITVVLDDFTIMVFKEKAQELGGSYQAMIRKLLLEYARTIKGDDKNMST
ncbi:MAG: CopG family transcriptional regulator [Chloroflexota bacterium]|nr:CopG family transcriptional regulator [Chloroflexota bacterium]